MRGLFPASSLCLLLLTTAACSGHGGDSRPDNFGAGTYVAFAADDPVGAVITLQRSGSRLSGAIFYRAQNGSSINTTTFTGTADTDTATLSFSGGKSLTAAWGAGLDPHNADGFELAECGELFPDGFVQTRAECDFHLESHP